MRNLFFIFLFVSGSALSGYGQTQEDPPSVIEFFNSLYQYDFNLARSQFRQIELSGITKDYIDIAELNLYWWLLVSGMEDEENEIKMTEAANRIIDRYSAFEAEKLTADALFSTVHAFAYLTRLAIYKNHYLRGIRNLNRTLPYLELVLSRYSENPKFMLLGGLYHYFAAITYQEEPLLRPFFAFAPEYSLDLGYQLLHACAENSHPLISTEAKYFLMKIHVEIKQDYQSGKFWSNQLLLKFPNNVMYRYHLLTSLVELDQMDAVRSELIKIQNTAQKNPSLNPSQKEHFVDESKKYIRKKRGKTII